jgi:hypothetical protein
MYPFLPWLAVGAGLDVAFYIPGDPTLEIALGDFVVGSIFAKVSGCGFVVAGL